MRCEIGGICPHRAAMSVVYYNTWKLSQRGLIDERVLHNTQAIFSFLNASNFVLESAKWLLHFRIVSLPVIILTNFSSLSKLLPACPRCLSSEYQEARSPGAFPVLLYHKQDHLLLLSSTWCPVLLSMRSYISLLGCSIFVLCKSWITIVSLLSPLWWPLDSIKLPHSAFIIITSGIIAMQRELCSRMLTQANRWALVISLFALPPYLIQDWEMS